MDGIKRVGVFLAALTMFFTTTAVAQNKAAVSSATRNCLACHKGLTPGIVADWENSRMSRVTPREAMEKPELQRRVSFDTVPENLADSVVGCAECHTLRTDKHEDSFKHGGTEVNVVVSPDDCATCHPVERQQFSQNLMSQAHGNLVDNPLYNAMVTAVNGPISLKDKALHQEAPDAMTNADACLFCHGTKLSVEKLESRDTPLGPMNFPVINGWPNQGVGRINPDGSKGNCTACHARHQFAIELARKPASCSECHKGPDVPAYKVYNISKHGNIYNALGQSEGWDFSAVPWTVGSDFTAPTCAACHMSLLTTPGGKVQIERTHRMNDRLAWRIFGLPYAHPHPEKADTTIIKNKDGLNLPTALDGTPAADYLISKETRAARTEKLQQVCAGCHATSWVEGHFERFEHTIDTTNAQTLTATQILEEAWNSGVESGPATGGSPFDETLERMWVEQWLFYANSTRFASAMIGADYGVFANGRWYLSKNPHEMMDLLKLKQKVKK